MNESYLALIVQLDRLLSKMAVEHIPLLLDVAELSRMVEIKPTAINYWLKSGFLPSQKIGPVRFVRFRLAAASYLKTKDSDEIILNPLSVSEKEAA